MLLFACIHCLHSTWFLDDRTLIPVLEVLNKQQQYACILYVHAWLANWRLINQPNQCSQIVTIQYLLVHKTLMQLVLGNVLRFNHIAILK